MGAYNYRALNDKGKVVKGIIEGDSERQVRSQLRSNALKVLEVSAANGRTQTSPSASGSFWSQRFSRNLNHRELTLVTRQLASLIASGLPLDESLKAAAGQQRKAHVKEILLQVRSRIVEGNSLAQALADNPGSFDDMYRALIKAGRRRVTWDR